MVSTNQLVRLLNARLRHLLNNFLHPGEILLFFSLSPCQLSIRIEPSFASLKMLLKVVILLKHSKLDDVMYQILGIDETE